MESSSSLIEKVKSGDISFLELAYLMQKHNKSNESLLSSDRTYRSVKSEFNCFRAI